MDGVLVLLPPEHADGGEPVEPQVAQGAEELVPVHLAVADLVVLVHARVHAGRVDDVAVADVGPVVEAVGDVQVLAESADKLQIIEALCKLRAANLLLGVRGTPADLGAVADTVLAIGGLMRSVPEISEIDVNPLMVHGEGDGATALDALIVVG